MERSNTKSTATVVNLEAVPSSSTTPSHPVSLATEAARFPLPYPCQGILKKRFHESRFAIPLWRARHKVEDAGLIAVVSAKMSASPDAPPCLWPRKAPAP